MFQAEKELREKRRQDALAAKRYPIDDLELLSEELTAAAAAALAAQNNQPPAQPEGGEDGGDGITAPGTPRLAAGLSAENADPLEACLGSAPAQQLDDAESQHMGQLLYVADTLSSFAKQLGLKGVSSGELQVCLTRLLFLGHSSGCVWGFCVGVMRVCRRKRPSYEAVLFAQHMIPVYVCSGVLHPMTCVVGFATFDGCFMCMLD
jgi:hypothetical protein